MHTIFTLTKLLAAYMSCRRRKRTAINSLKFELNLEASLLYLQKKLKSHTYRPKRSICFIVDYPKVREIFAADFSDRIIHHLLVSEIEPYFEKIFIHNSFACRKEKGPHMALKTVRKSLYGITKNRTNKAFYAQLDIQSFFTSIDKNILYRTIVSRIIKLRRPQAWKEEIYYLLKTIIFHDPTKSFAVKGDVALFEKLPMRKSLFNAPHSKGLPIGNLTSQFFANVYLDSLDHYIKRELNVKYYCRYADDLVLLSHNSDALKIWRGKINCYLQERLKLLLHPDKDVFGSVYQGIDFVGYVIRPNYVLCRKRVASNLKTKLYFFNQLSRTPTKSEVKQAAAMVNSYFGHFRFCNSYRLRKNIYENHFGKLKNYLKPEKNLRFFSPFKPSR